MSYAKAIFINVEKIFKHIIKIEEIEVIGETNDSIMYVNMKSRDTLQLEKVGYGPYPQTGESVLKITYQLNEDIQRFLFAKKEQENYKFWYPRSIDFANTVFLVPLEGIYTPTNGTHIKSFTLHNKYPCDAYLTRGRYPCDAFLIKQKEFEQIKVKYDKKD